MISSKFIHIKNEKKDNLIISNTDDFSTSGLGYVQSSKIFFATPSNDKNLTEQILEMFNNTWNSDDKLEDVKEKVLESIEKLYKDNTPEYIYFVTLLNSMKL